jgi:membrane protease YdiL (CAAX protease family)
VRAALGRVTAIARGEIRSYAREWSSVIGFVVLALGAGLGPSLFEHVSGDDEDEEAPTTSAEEARDAGVPACPAPFEVLVADGVPRWVDAEPIGLPPGDEPAVLVRAVTRPAQAIELEVVALQESRGALDAVERCVEERERAERRRRSELYGVTEDPRDNTRVRWLVEPLSFSDRLPETNRLGATAALLAVSFSLGLLAELMARLRSSGLLETLLLVPVRPAEILAAMVAAATVIVGLGVTLALLVHAAASVAFGAEIGGSWSLLWVVPAIVALVTHAVWANADVPDLRAATFRTLRVTFEWQALVMAAMGLWYAVGPTAGALVPLGGLLLAVAGWGDPLPAVLSSAAWVGLLGWSATHRLARGGGQGAFDEGVAARHAEGRYGREVLILFFAGTAGTLAWVPSLLLPYPTAAVVMGQLAFFLLPALGVSWVVGLDARRVLQWRAPGWRAWAATPSVAIGMFSLGSLVYRGWEAWIGVDSAVLESFGLMIPGTDDLVGMLVFSLVPGVCEELMFRGAILGLLRRRGGHLGPVVAQAILFGLAHVLAFRVAPTAAMGLLLGWFAVRTRSVAPGMVAHAVNNLLAMGLASAAAAGSFPARPPIVLLIGGVVVGLVAVWWSGDGPSKDDP